MTPQKQGRDEKEASDPASGRGDQATPAPPQRRSPEAPAPAGAQGGMVVKTTPQGGDYRYSIVGVTIDVGVRLFYCEKLCLVIPIY